MMESSVDSFPPAAGPLSPDLEGASDLPRDSLSHVSCVSFKDFSLASCFSFAKTLGLGLAAAELATPNDFGLNDNDICLPLPFSKGFTVFSSRADDDTSWTNEFVKTGVLPRVLPLPAWLAPAPLPAHALAQTVRPALALPVSLEPLSVLPLRVSRRAKL